MTNYMKVAVKCVSEVNRRPHMRVWKENFFLLLIFLFSVGYAAFLSSLPIDVFKDRINYLRYASSSLKTLRLYYESGLFVVLSNEPLWLCINGFLSLFIKPETVVRILILSSSFFVSWHILRNNKEYFFWIVFFLFMPQVIKNHIVHLRQGVAISFFLAGWYGSGQIRKWFFIGSTPFIHASFAFVLALLCVSACLKQLPLAADIRNLILLCYAVLISLSLSWLGRLLGARQASEYVFSATHVSGLGFIFWSIVFMVMLFEGRHYLRQYSFEVSGLLFYLASYWLIPVTARIFESMLLLILVAGLRLGGWQRIIFLLSIAAIFFIQYGLRIHLPWLGFGVSLG